MRRSYPQPAPPCDHSVIMAKLKTGERISNGGILHEVGDTTLMAGTCKEGFFVCADDGEETKEQTFEREFDAATFLMNLAAYAADEEAA